VFLAIVDENSARFCYSTVTGSEYFSLSWICKLNSEFLFVISYLYPTKHFRHKNMAKQKN